MAIHFTAFVLPAATSGLSHDMPVLAVGADTAEETEEISLVLSIHQARGIAVPLSPALKALAEIPVSQAWVTAVEQHNRRARAVLLREAISADIPSRYKEFAEELGPDVPSWAGMLLSGRILVATRDVPVTSGEDPLLMSLVDASRNSA
ncbi:hypothetical protein ACFV2X_43000 [Streptomyces sp. NPDC059679]|uniref:hypothetical protein n=1 Tax=Streptomyces sp. NPDC059679 TaxID=3346903 RepID=UPI0036992BB2